MCYQKYIITTWCYLLSLPYSVLTGARLKCWLGAKYSTVNNAGFPIRPSTVNFRHLLPPLSTVTCQRSWKKCVGLCCVTSCPSPAAWANSPSTSSEMENPAMHAIIHSVGWHCWLLQCQTGWHCWLLQCQTGWHCWLLQCQTGWHCWLLQCQTGWHCWLLQCQTGWHCWLVQCQTGWHCWLLQCQTGWHCWLLQCQTSRWSSCHEILQIPVKPSCWANQMQHAVAVQSPLQVAGLLHSWFRAPPPKGFPLISMIIYAAMPYPWNIMAALCMSTGDIIPSEMGLLPMLINIWLDWRLDSRVPEPAHSSRVYFLDELCAQGSLVGCRMPLTPPPIHPTHPPQYGPDTGTASTNNTQY